MFHFTRLYERHLSLGAKMMDYCGWKMPLCYKNGTIKEHENVRKNAGLFDVSHMGFIRLSGKDFFPFLKKYCAL